MCCENVRQVHVLHQSRKVSQLSKRQKMKATLLLIIIASTFIQESEAGRERETINVDGKTYYRVGPGRYVSRKRTYSKQAIDACYKRVLKDTDMKRVHRSSDCVRNGEELNLMRDLAERDSINRFTMSETPVTPKKKGFWRRLLEFIINPF